MVKRGYLCDFVDLTELNLTITFMDRKTMTWGLYEAPSVKTLDIMSEGVLCASGAFGINQLVEDGEDALEF